MDERLKDRVAIITGGSSGLGRATALKFAKAGARIVIADIQDIGVVDQILSTNGPNSAVFIKCDITQEDEIRALVSETRGFGGRIDILINSAGCAVENKHNPFPRTHDLPTEDFDRAWALNTRGTWLCCKYVLQQMLEQEPREANARGDRTRGWIVNMASVMGLVGMGGLAAYVPSKHAVVGMTKQVSLNRTDMQDCNRLKLLQMAAAYAKDRVHINCLCPSFTKTPMIEKQTSVPAANTWLESLHPWGALGEPDDIEGAALFLCSDDAAWVTGCALTVDGAFTAV